MQAKIEGDEAWGTVAAEQARSTDWRPRLPIPNVEWCAASEETSSVRWREHHRDLSLARTNFSYHKVVYLVRLSERQWALGRADEV